MLHSLCSRRRSRSSDSICLLLCSRRLLVLSIRPFSSRAYCAWRPQHGRGVASFLGLHRHLSPPRWLPAVGCQPRALASEPFAQCLCSWIAVSPPGSTVRSLLLHVRPRCKSRLCCPGSNEPFLPSPLPPARLLHLSFPQGAISLGTRDLPPLAES